MFAHGWAVNGALRAWLRETRAARRKRQARGDWGRRPSGRRRRTLVDEVAGPAGMVVAAGAQADPRSR